MVSKGNLGLSYLFGTSLGLFVRLFGYYLLAPTGLVVTAIGVVTAVILAGSLMLIGYWLRRKEFDDTDSNGSVVRLDLPRARSKPEPAHPVATYWNRLIDSLGVSPLW